MASTQMLRATAPPSPQPAQPAHLLPSRKNLCEEKALRSPPVGEADEEAVVERESWPGAATRKNPEGSGWVASRPQRGEPDIL